MIYTSFIIQLHERNHKATDFIKTKQQQKAEDAENLHHP